MRRYIYDEKLKKVVEINPETPASNGLTVIPDEKEFISHNAFPETVKWTGRRSKKRIMKQYGAIDARDTVGVGREKERKIQRLREGYKKDPMIRTDIDIIREKDTAGRKATRKKYFFTGR